MLYRHIGGHVVCETLRVMPDALIEPTIREHHDSARALKRSGAVVAARRTALAALTLHQAALAAGQWRRAQGWAA